jgi:hypothetical protein
MIRLRFQDASPVGLHPNHHESACARASRTMQLTVHSKAEVLTPCHLSVDARLGEDVVVLNAI